MMTTSVLFQVALELWGIAFCLIGSACIIAMRQSDPKYNRRKLSMQICCIILLMNDSLAWIFRGQSTEAAYVIVRVSNFLVYFTNYILMALFANFMWMSVAGKKARLPRRVLAVYLTAGIAILLLVISQFNGMFYYIDSQNEYYRGPYYIFTQSFAIIGLALCFTLLMQHRKELDRMVFYAMLSYFVFPVIATIFQALYYGLSLQTFALVLSTQLMFVVDLIKLSSQLDSSKSAFRIASHAAEHDTMTGLLNKSSGIQKMDEYLAQMTDEDTASLIFVDIDDFKSINDTYGHSVGDFWIKEVANLLLRNCRPEDIASRFGGDEFILLMKHAAEKEVLADRMALFARQLEQSAQQQGQPVHCSIGICRIFGSAQKIRLCLDLADKALYEAKRNGKNTFAMRDIGQKKLAR